MLWLDEGSRTLANDIREGLDSEPDPPWRVPDDPQMPWGPPGAAWGRFLVMLERADGPPRAIYKAASRRGWRWLAGQLRRAPWMVSVTLNRLDDTGQPTSLCLLDISAFSKAPGWIRLHTSVPARLFAHELHGTSHQRQSVAFLRSYANRLNPSYGQIGVSHNIGETTLEACLPLEFGRNRPWNTIVESRQFLRGYTWLTIVAEELAARLGGVEAIAATGVFHEVIQLDAGGLWLRATEDFRDYGLAKAEQVFRVLAPVLRPGKPEPPMLDPRTGRPPHNEPYLLVYEDAAEAAGRSPD